MAISKEPEMETRPDIEPVMKEETAKVDKLKCPGKFPQKKWDSWSDSAKRNYLKIIGGDE